MAEGRNTKVVIVNIKAPGVRADEKDSSDRYVDSLKYLLNHSAKRFLGGHSLEIELCTTVEEARVWA
jgi:hypothetical protein